MAWLDYPNVWHGMTPDGATKRTITINAPKKIASAIYVRIDVEPNTIKVVHDTLTDWTYGAQSQDRPLWAARDTQYDAKGMPYCFNVIRRTDAWNALRVRADFTITAVSGSHIAAGQLAVELV